MELVLQRSYHALGTNGALSYGGYLICYAIELPWLFNKLKDVPFRSPILIHKANNVVKQLKGCIGAVGELTGAGRGKNSAAAFARLMKLATRCLNNQEQIWLRIKDRWIFTAKKNT